MNDTANANANADANLGELTFVRVYDAPRELVYQCMVTPAHLTHFWGPPGASAPLDKITIDARPVGASKHVLAINTDKEANMVGKAEYAVVGDLHAILPAVSAEIRKRRG